MSRVANFRRRGDGVWGGGIPLPSLLGSLGERHELPQWGLGRAPAENEFGAYKVSQKACGWRKIRYFVRHLYRLIWPLLDINWQNSRVGAKTSRQPGHFQVSRVSCIGWKGLQLRTRPVPGGSGTFVHVVNSSFVLLLQNMNRGLHFVAHKLNCLCSILSNSHTAALDQLRVVAISIISGPSLRIDRHSGTDGYRPIIFFHLLKPSSLWWALPVSGRRCTGEGVNG